MVASDTASLDGQTWMLSSHSVLVDLLHDKDLAFCYALLRNDKIRQSDDNYRTVSVENVNCFFFSIY